MSWNQKYFASADCRTNISSFVYSWNCILLYQQAYVICEWYSLKKVQHFQEPIVRKFYDL